MENIYVSEDETKRNYMISQKELMESTNSSASPFQRTVQPHMIDTSKDSSQKAHTGTQTSTPSFPSQNKMDEKGVHSPTNAIKFIVSDDKDTASPVQTVAGKNTSNPFMAVTLPKSEDEGSSSRRRLPRSFTQDKHIITTETPDPSEDRLVPDAGLIYTSSRRDNPTNIRTRSLSSGEDDYRDNSYYQDAQNPNEDDDSGMNFDSITLHNLDT
ncbi:hypothetical protein H5410_035711 [Solanum commersonii]|uniref:Uncharacterized protein n=1 Tax=Solanum commersonii TaxID=4109 RepID=A0A9J5Y3M0_SOLCO|nr:hypothetical protein H5410_035711 [Solanum commersonii]